VWHPVVTSRPSGVTCISGSTIDAADFVAGIEIGFGQSLDKLAAVLAADRSTNPDRSTP